MSYTFDQAYEIIQQLAQAPSKLVSNEAQTRLDLIDKVLFSCLNWGGRGTQVEVSNDNGFSDYELGQPVKIIVEAKKEGIWFDIPDTTSNQKIYNIQSLIRDNKNLEAALKQVQSYCSSQGVEIGLVTNGHQFVGFIASRNDGVKPLQGKCIVYRSLSDIADNFITFWNYFSFDGISKNNLILALKISTVTIPSKVSKTIQGHPKLKDSDDVQTTLRQLSDLILQDLITSKEVEKSFFQSCYCKSGPLTQYALVSKNILLSRYESLFEDTGNKPLALPVNPKGSTGATFKKEAIAEAVAKRPIVLIGDVGVGKTSFIKNLIYNDATDEFKNSIYIYIDFGSKANLTENIKQYTLNEITDQLNSNIHGSINKKEFIEVLYKSKITEFESGPNALIKDLDQPEYNKRKADFLLSLINNKEDHTKSVIKHLTQQMRKNVIVFIDNADQRDFDVQQNAFLIAQELSSTWDAITFVAVRPNTFFKSKRHGSLSAYPPKVFTISPPRLEEALTRRLSFALDIADGGKIERIKNLTINISSLVAFLKIIKDSIKENNLLVELIANITGGNVRLAFEIITKFIGNPNVDAYKILKAYDSDGKYIIPIHELEKSILLDDYEQFNKDSSSALNIYDISTADFREHFLTPTLLSLLHHEEHQQDKNGYVSMEYCLAVLQSEIGFTESQIKWHITNCINKKLIEIPQRITFEESDIIKNANEITKIRVTPSGVYHIKKWACSFAYLEVMSVDTPIFEKPAATEIEESLVASLANRYKRAKEFRTYLFDKWKEARIVYKHYNFEDTLHNMEKTFYSVEKALIGQGKVL